MGKSLESLVKAARKIKMTPKQQEEQRKSFAYGNAHIENKNVTRATVERAAKAMKKAV